MGWFRFYRPRAFLVAVPVVLFSVAALAAMQSTRGQEQSRNGGTGQIAQDMIDEGRTTFRFDTFGDEAFWGGQLRLNEAIASSLSPRAALDLGLKVDVDALPQQLIQRIGRGDVNLDDPATTLQLLRLNAVVGLTGFFDASGTKLTSIGIQCGHVRVSPDDDRITSKLPALHFYQLSITAPKPTPGVDFDVDRAERGDELFEGKAGCNNCHVEPLWTEPGWNLHKPAEIGIDSFEADRAPDHLYKTQNLAASFIQERGLFMRPSNKGRFYHDGRFATLLDVVNHYNIQFNLGLTAQGKLDLIEYLKSL
jgi:hypothetical protein